MRWSQGRKLWTTSAHLVMQGARGKISALGWGRGPVISWDGGSLQGQACHIAPAGLEATPCGRCGYKSPFILQMLKCPSFVLDAGDAFTGKIDIEPLQGSELGIPLLIRSYIIANCVKCREGKARCKRLL